MTTPLICPDCGGELVLRRGKYGLHYLCEHYPRCRGHHGAHPDGSPLGVPADLETRKARMRAHKAFDRLWKPGDRGGRMSRQAAYRRLQRIMGLSEGEAHIGRFTKEQCERLIAHLGPNHRSTDMAYHDDGSRPGGVNDDFSDLGSFDQDYRPEKLFTLGLETLSDGDYDFEVVSAELTRTQKSSDRILRTVLRVNGGQTLEKAWFLKSQDNMNALGADLVALGFDADRWGVAGRSVAQELPRAVARMAGLKFRGRKASRPDKNDAKKIYHDLYINAVLSGKPQPNGTAPAGPPAPPPGPGAPPAPPRVLYWTWDAVAGKPTEADQHRVQTLCDVAKDAAKVPLMRQDQAAAGWRTAADLGFSATPF